MVAEYNQAARKQQLSEDQMLAVRGNLLEPSPDAEEAGRLERPDFFGFHVVVVCMALHHVPEPSKLVGKLAERLDYHGTLVIVDAVAPSESGIVTKEGADGHVATKTVASHGFTRQEMLDMFSDAGLVDVDIRWYPRRSLVPAEMGGEQQLFFARAKRPGPPST
jgi:hypothetical protein